MLEIRGIASCHGCTVRACNRRDHGVELRDRPARCLASRYNSGERPRRVFIEGQDSGFKFLSEHSLDGPQ